MKNAINFMGFYLIWFACVLYGNYAVSWALLAIAIHLYSVGDRQELWLVLVVTLLGIVVDSFLMFFGVFIFAEQTIVIPFWLMAIWMAFACTLRHSLHVFHKYPQWQISAGAISGPASYYAGYSLGAVEFGHSVLLTMVLLAFIWALMFKLVMTLSTFTRKELSYAQTYEL